MLLCLLGLLLLGSVLVILGYECIFGLVGGDYCGVYWREFFEWGVFCL